jgi:hypothetical protein
LIFEGHLTFLQALLVLAVNNAHNYCLPAWHSKDESADPAVVM